MSKFFYALKKVLEWYAAFYKQPFDSPFQQVSAPSEDNWRSRRRVGDEEARIVLACEVMRVSQEKLKRVNAFALETDMRACEILKLELHEVTRGTVSAHAHRHHDALLRSAS